MVASYINGQNERFFVIEDYTINGFNIQIDKKEATEEFYGKIYNSYEPYDLIKTMKDLDLENLKNSIKDYTYKLILLGNSLIMSNY